MHGESYLGRKGCKGNLAAADVEILVPVYVMFALRLLLRKEEFSLIQLLQKEN